MSIVSSSSLVQSLIVWKSRALFSRAVSELKYMGMIKHSSRKADHVAKLLWNGL